MKMVTDGKGTPMSPGSPLHVYVFALFNKNMKPRPASERHYGLFNPDMSPAYDIRIKPSNSSTSSGGGGADADSPSHSTGASSSTGFYTISAAPEKLFRVTNAVAVAMVFYVVLVVV